MSSIKNIKETESKTEKQEKPDHQPKSGTVTLVLVAISLLVLGSLGILFLSQIKLIEGWEWNELEGKYSGDPRILNAGDVNDDDFDDILCYTDVEREEKDIEDNTPRKGGLFMVDGKTGDLLWSQEYDGPVKKAFRIGDIDNDGIDDIFVNIATVEKHFDEDGQIVLIENSWINRIVSGKDGEFINEEDFENEEPSQSYIPYVIDLGNYEDNMEDLILLEFYFNETEATPEHGDSFYNIYLKGIYVNGTIKNSNNIYNYSGGGDIYNTDNSYSIDLLEVNGQLAVFTLVRGNSNSSVALFNISTTNYAPIYTRELSYWADFYVAVKDLNGDGTRDIVTIPSSYASEEGSTLISGKDGTTLKDIDSPTGDEFTKLTVIESEDEDISYVLFSTAENKGKGDGSDPNQERTYTWAAYSLTSSKAEEIWKKELDETQESSSFCGPISDLNDDSVSELVFVEYSSSNTGQQSFATYHLMDFIEDKELGVITITYIPNQVLILGDLDSDGIDDLWLSTWGGVSAIALKDPLPLFLSPEFPLGIPMFIGSIVFVVFGVVILFFTHKQVNFSRKKALKENKLAVIVNVISVSLVAVSFVMLIYLLNVFTSTMVTGFQTTLIALSYVTIISLWFAILPMTAAIYNQWSPRFAVLFISLRNLFFKMSKSYNNEIMVLSLGDRTKLGNANKLKRVVLPMLLSISVAFYVYNALAAPLGYPQGFDSMNSPIFFQFIVGYAILVVLPLIFSFILFSFFIAGNYLLDDAGIVYYRESKKYRKPGDTEPISVWSQSLIKGIAGISALLTFFEFMITTNIFAAFLSGDQGAGFMIFGIFFVVSFFYGLPFLTGFSYILLSTDIMDLTREKNVQKLYKKMQKKGYDTTPRELLHLYPAGTSPFKKVETSPLEKPKEKVEKPPMEKGKEKVEKPPLEKGKEKVEKPPLEKGKEKVEKPPLEKGKEKVEKPPMEKGREKVEKPPLEKGKEKVEKPPMEKGKEKVEKLPLEKSKEKVEKPPLEKGKEKAKENKKT